MKIAKMGDYVKVTEYTRMDIENFIKYDLPFCEHFDEQSVYFYCGNGMNAPIMGILLEMLIKE